MAKGREDGEWGMGLDFFQKDGIIYERPAETKEKKWGNLGMVRDGAN